MSFDGLRVSETRAIRQISSPDSQSRIREPQPFVHPRKRRENACGSVGRLGVPRRRPSKFKFNRNEERDRDVFQNRSERRLR